METKTAMLDQITLLLMDSYAPDPDDYDPIEDYFESMLDYEEDNPQDYNDKEN